LSIIIEFLLENSNVHSDDGCVYLQSMYDSMYRTKTIFWLFNIRSHMLHLRSL